MFLRAGETGVLCEGFALFQWTLRLLQGLGFVAQHMGMDPLQKDHGRAFTFLQGFCWGY